MSALKAAPGGPYVLVPINAVLSPAAQRVLTYIQANPETRQDAIAHALNLSEGVVSYHIKRLRDLGLVSITRPRTGPRWSRLVTIRQDALHEPPGGA